MFMILVVIAATLPLGHPALLPQPTIIGEVVAEPGDDHQISGSMLIVGENKELYIAAKTGTLHSVTDPSPHTTTSTTFAGAGIVGAAYYSGDSKYYYCKNDTHNPVDDDGAPIVISSSLTGYCAALTVDPEYGELYEQTTTGEIWKFKQSISGGSWTITQFGSTDFPKAVNAFAAGNDYVFIDTDEAMYGYAEDTTPVSTIPVGDYHGAAVYSIVGQLSLCVWEWSVIATPGKIVCYGVFPSTFDPLVSADSNRLSAGAIIGIVFGCVGGAFVIYLLAINLYLHNKRPR